MRRLSLLSLLLARPVAAQEAPLKLAAEEKEVLELTNVERKNKDLGPLKLSPHLVQVARAHATNMAKQEKMEHKLDGKTPFDRLRDAGYRYARTGENIAAGDPEASTPPLVMKAWMESKNHRDNILQPDFTELGVGTARDRSGRIYYVQVFARPLATD
jgi:uncharacterized protein YkwD